MDITKIIASFFEMGSNPIAEGKSKVIYPTEDPSLHFMRFKPHLRSLTAAREEDIANTDYWRALSSLDIMQTLESEGIPTQIRYPKAIKAGEQNHLYLAVDNVEPIPIEWIARYEAAGSIVKFFPDLVRQGQKFSQPLFKYDYKQDISVAGVDDPTLNESYIVGLGLLGERQLQEAKNLLSRTSESLRRRLEQAGIGLIDIKMEFGFDSRGRIIVIDEISQDCMRAYDLATGKPITKDLFRQLKSPYEVLQAYETFAKKLNPNIESLVQA